MRESDIHINRVDWIAVCIYFALVLIGWFNIYAAVFDSQIPKSIFDLSINSGQQLIRMAAALVLIVLIMVADPRFFENLALYIFIAFMILLLATPFLGNWSTDSVLGLNSVPFKYNLENLPNLPQHLPWPK